MSKIADRIKGTQNKEEMLREAIEKLIQLYTDRSHFVYELLQNAEDAEAKRIKFVQYPDRLEVMHDGKPFTFRNLQGLCDIGKSDKIGNLNQIGEFGVGFKSVFGICETVELYSEPTNFKGGAVGDAIPFAVEIIGFINPRDIEFKSLDRAFTTRFVFPYAVGRTFSGFKTTAELNSKLSSKLQNLGITTLLFMKNLETIEYQINLNNNTIEGQYLLEKTAINDHCSFVSALGLSDSQRANKELSEEISYLMFSRPIDKTSKRTVDIAFPVVVTADGKFECQKPKNPYISVYFPTETESKLGFIVQGPYRTTPNRSSIPADAEDNIRLANETATLLREAILEMRETGKFNMSFVKALPLSVRMFDNYSLFKPLYETVLNLFTRDSIIPCRNGGYVSAKHAKIARQERLAGLFTDELLSELIHDGCKYYWLPTYLTETNREYEQVYKYLTGELKVSVIRPEDLRVHFAANRSFLPKQSDEWLVELYSILENVGAAFSRSRNETNMLTADIIKTSTGAFVAAYRKTESKKYIPNVFLPSKHVQSKDINFVDTKIYERCRHFFDDILQLQQPNEYEFFVSDIRKRYSGQYVCNETQHIEDIKRLCKYLKYEGYKDEIMRIIKEIFVVRCNDGHMRSIYKTRVFLPVSASGIQIETYLKNIAKNIFFVDLEFYSDQGISFDMLCELGVKGSLLCNQDITGGEYSTGKCGKQPEWWTMGDFRWKMTIEHLKEALKYISEHPSAKDSIVKSKTILAVLLENESLICGMVHIGGSTPNKINEPCEMVHVLRGERINDWNGKWLYTESMELVSHKQISKHDLSSAIYGKIKPDSIAYELLGFRKTESDEVDELKKKIPQKQLDAFFEEELRRRFGLSSADISERFNGSRSRGVEDAPDNDIVYPFPTVRIKNWDALKKHAAEMLCFANPVKYDFAVRRIRVSNRPKEVQAYLRNMYRYEGQYGYACQMCHESCSSIEAVQMFNNPETELDPIHICLCPNCAEIYRHSRRDGTEMDLFRNQILALKEHEMTSADPVVLVVDGQELWFTQVHIAEIQALLQLEIDVKQKPPIPVATEPNDEGDTSGLSVYSSYKGKQIKRKDGFVGLVVDVTDEYLIVKILNGPKAGAEMKIQIAFVVKNPGVYQIVNE